MKRTISLILAAFMLATVLALASCGTTDSAKKYERGTVDGNVYRSDYLDITFTKPDAWRYSTDEEIAAAMGMAVDVLKDGEKFINSDTASSIEFQAVDISTGCNVVLTVEKQSALGAAVNSIDDMVAAFKKMLVEQVEGSSMSVNLSDTVSEEKIGENTYQCLEATVSLNGVSMRQVYLMRKVDRYLVSICITLLGDATVESIEAMFS